MKSKRFDLRIPVRLHALAKQRAEELGVSLAEYIKDLMKKELY